MRATDKEVLWEAQRLLTAARRGDEAARARLRELFAPSVEMRAASRLAARLLVEAALARWTPVAGDAKRSLVRNCEDRNSPTAAEIDSHRRKHPDFDHMCRDLHIDPTPEEIAKLTAVKTHKLKPSDWVIAAAAVKFGTTPRHIERSRAAFRKAAKEHGGGERGAFAGVLVVLMRSRRALRRLKSKPSCTLGE